MKSQRFLQTMAAVALTVASASLFAQPLVDGTKDASYGAALTSQTWQTGYGDANGNLLGGNGGELDALYVANDGSRLYILVTGNLEANGNLISLLFDVVSDTAGQNTLTPVAGKDNIFDTNHLGGAILPTDFNCDYIFCHKGFDNGINGVSYDFIYITFDVSTGTIAYPNPDVFTMATTNPMITTDSATGPLFDFGFNNSNTAGVAGGNAAAVNADALAVTTGFEVSIPLSVLGATGGDQVKMFAIYSNQDAGNISNQFLPPHPTSGVNVGGPSGGPPTIFNFGSTGQNLSVATYTITAAPSDATNWALYE